MKIGAISAIIVALTAPPSVAETMPASPAPVSLKGIIELPDCDSAALIPEAYRLTTDFDAAQATQKLGDRSLTYWIDGYIVRIAARGAENAAAMPCCAFQGKLDEIGGAGDARVWGAAFNIPDLNRSVLSFILPGAEMLPEYRGGAAPKAPQAVEILKGRIETVEIDSPNLMGKRKLNIYVPEAPPPPGGYPVVYLADGQRIKGAWPYMVEALIEAGLIRPLLLVGIESGSGERVNGMDRRNREYLPGRFADPDTYARHEAFVLTEVIPLIERDYHAGTRRDDRLTAGVSSGATWAASFALRHSDKFAQAGAFSVSQPTDGFGLEAARNVKLYLSAGKYEPAFLTATRRLCTSAMTAGLECHIREFYAGHDNAMWDIALMDTLKAVFPAP